MRVVVLLAVGVLAVIVGVAFGWRWVIAPALGWAIWSWSRAMLRGMVHGRAPGVDDEAPAASTSERTLYWCEECGAELLLTVRGAGTPPRHCGARMHERVELIGE